MEKTTPSGPEIGQAMLTLLEVCGFKVPEDALIPMYEAIAFVGHMAHTKGMSLTLSDLEHIKKAVKDMLPEPEEAPQEAPASPAEMVDLMDGWYVRDIATDTPVAWFPSYEAIEGYYDYNDSQLGIAEMRALVKNVTNLKPGDFIPLREKYYANANT